MRKNKLLAFICAFTMLASSFGAMSVNVFASEEIPDPPAAGEEATPAPPDPLTPLAVSALPKDRTVTFDAGYVDETKTTYTIPDVFGEYVAVYAGEYDGGARNIEIDGSNKTFDDTRRYTTRIKLGGSVVLDENGAPAIRTISVTPAEDGVLVIDFAHASSSGDARTLAAYQSGEIIGTALAEADNQNTLAVEVEANEPVYIYSQNSGINIYGIYLTDSYTPPTEPEPPADIQVTPLPLGANISFADSGLTDRQQITESTVLAGGYVAAYATSSRYLEARNSNQTIDGVSYTMAIRTYGGATVGSDGIPTDRAIMVTPEEAGLLKVPFRHGSGTDDVRDLIAVQNGEIIGTEDVVGDNNAVLQVRVAADAPVYIYSTGNVNIYGVKLEEIIEPTPLPAGTRVTFDAGYNADTEMGTTFTETTVFDDYTVVYANEDATVEINDRSREVNGYEYTTAIRLSNAALSGVVPTARAISVTPAVAETLTVDFLHPGSDGTRTLTIVQNDAVLITLSVEVSESATATAQVAAGEPVYIYADSGIDVLGILLGKEGSVTPPTEDTVQPTPLPANTRVTFDTGSGRTFTETTVFDNYTVVYANADETVEVVPSNREINGYQYSTAIRLNNAALSGLVPTARAISVTPAEAGTLTVDFGHPGSESTRTLTIVQNGEVIAEQGIEPENEMSATASVAAGAPVYIYTDAGINVYGVILSGSGVTPPADEIVRITATYDSSNVLQNVSIETINASEAETPVLEDQTRVFYWDSIESMRPYVPAE